MINDLKSFHIIFSGILCAWGSGFNLLDPGPFKLIKALHNPDQMVLLRSDQYLPRKSLLRIRALISVRPEWTLNFWDTVHFKVRIRIRSCIKISFRSGRYISPSCAAGPFPAPVFSPCWRSPPHISSPNWCTR